MDKATPTPPPAYEAVTIQNLDAAFAQEIRTVSSLEYNSNEMCRAFYANLRARLVEGCLAAQSEPTLHQVGWMRLDNVHDVATHPSAADDAMRTPCFIATQPAPAVAQSAPLQQAAREETPDAGPLVQQLQGLIAGISDLERSAAKLRQDLQISRWEAGVLWDVAREGLERGEAYYNVVKRRLGQEQADRDRAAAQVEPAELTNDQITAGYLAMLESIEVVGMDRAVQRFRDAVSKGDHK